MQSISVKQLLQSPTAFAAKGEVALEKQTGVEGALTGEEILSVKDIAGKSQGKNAVNSEFDFSSLFNEAKDAELPAPSAKSLKQENAISSNIAKTSNNLDQLLNNLKGIEAQGQEQSAPIVEDGEPSTSLRKSFFPNQKNESENPLEFLLKSAKGKNLSLNESPIEVSGKGADLEGLVEFSNNSKATPVKNGFFPNKITNPAMIEKSQNQEQAVKVLSGEDFVKNLNAASSPSKGEEAIGIEKFNELGKSGKAEKLDKKQLAVFPNNLSQIKTYGKGQNILNDGLVRNTQDLAFKETKKLKTGPTDELRSPDLKTAADLAMIKESPIATLQLKASPVEENKVPVETKVLNLSHIDAKNTNEIIKTISDYVEQNQVANRENLDLTVKHDSLGQFKIQVTKMPNQNQVDMQITTSSNEGHKFFVQHEVDLMKNLQQSGVSLSDLRIVSSMKEATPFSQSESKQFSSFQHDQNGDSKQFMSFESSSDFREGSQRRKALWDEYQERYGA